MSRTLIIAEAGVNHNGNLDTALKLCFEAKKSGADVVKFQTWITEKIITKNVSQASYQSENTKKEESQFDMLKKLELSFNDFSEIKKYCDSIGIQFASTADDKESLDFLISLSIPFIKISSGDICNIPYLRYIGSQRLPIIMSTGMSNISDIDISLRTLQDAGTNNISILHCTTNYPCPMNDVNLKAMETLKNTFNLQIGYSDHTKGIEIPIAAVALGANIIEKHFTLDCNMEGPDHKASTEPVEFKYMVDCIRNIEIALGSRIKKPTTDEKIISEVVLKKIVASRYITEGSIITEKDLTTKRNKDGLPAKLWDNVIGIRAIKNYKEDEEIIL